MQVIYAILSFISWIKLPMKIIAIFVQQKFSNHVLALQKLFQYFVIAGLFGSTTTDFDTSNTS